MAGSGTRICQIAESQSGRTGCSRGDFNLDGVVSNDDMAIWTSNAWRQSCVPNAETMLTPAFEHQSAAPDRGGQRERVAAAGGGDGRRVVDACGQPERRNADPARRRRRGLPCGGGLKIGMDVVEAWDSTGALCRAFFNVISLEEVARAGKAIVIAGRKSADDPLWPTTDYLANFGYNTLLYRGYSKANIQLPKPCDAPGRGRERCL